METLMEDSHYTAFPNGQKRPRVHVIGNGDSNHLFDVQAEYRVGCNIPQHGIPVNCISMVDVNPIMWGKDNKWHPHVPVLCTPDVKNYAVKMNREGHWFDVYKKIHRYSAGHQAVNHHAGMTDEVHMWGFDSIWTNEYYSQMDVIVPRPKRPNLNQQWIPHWQEMFAKYKDTEFIIHAPQHAQLPELGDNVRKA